jgi:cytochrome c-type biogenesis protein CcmH/NrfG
MGNRYVDCYQRIVDTNPGKTSLIIFGDALMAIQRPEAAIDAYEKAAEMDPEDVELATQIGEALVETHDYQNAIQCVAVVVVVVVVIVVVVFVS